MKKRSRKQRQKLTSGPHIIIDGTGLEEVLTMATENIIKILTSVNTSDPVKIEALVTLRSLVKPMNATISNCTLGRTE